MQVTSVLREGKVALSCELVGGKGGEGGRTGTCRVFGQMTCVGKQIRKTGKEKD